MHETLRRRLSRFPRPLLSMIAAIFLASWALLPENATGEATSRHGGGPKPTTVSDAAKFAFGSVVIGADAQAVELPVSLPSPAMKLVTIHYRTSEGSARQGINYVPTEGTLKFRPGSRTQVIRVPLIQDNRELSTRTFTVHLGNANAGPAARVLLTPQVGCCNGICPCPCP